MLNSNIKDHIQEIHDKSRDVDINWLWKIIFTTNRMIYSACWGAHAPRIISSRILRFKVSGHLHKGHVYVNINGVDTIDIRLTTTKGTVKKEIKGIYIDQLVEVLDNHIENDKAVYG